jgi:hypothetical protein
MSHSLYLEVDVRDAPIGTRDVVFFVYRDDEKFGELRVSKGSVVWRGRNDKYGRKLTWSRFDGLMQEHGRRSELRPPKARKTVPAAKRQ